MPKDLKSTSIKIDSDTLALLNKARVIVLRRDPDLKPTVNNVLKKALGGFIQNAAAK